MEAVAALWSLSGPDPYAELVFQRGWMPSCHEEWLGEATINILGEPATLDQAMRRQYLTSPPELEEPPSKSQPLRLRPSRVATRVATWAVIHLTRSDTWRNQPRTRELKRPLATLPEPSATTVRDREAPFQIPAPTTLELGSPHGARSKVIRLPSGGRSTVAADIKLTRLSTSSVSMDRTLFCVLIMSRLVTGTFSL